MQDEHPDLVIVGGGPAGLSAAIKAHRIGLSVTVLEREAQAGGAPRHCGHLGFGMLDMARLWTGPQYASALREKTENIDVRCGHAVTALLDDGTLAVSGPQGGYRIQGQRVLLATGIRETPRSAQLVSGDRPFVADKDVDPGREIALWQEGRVGTVLAAAPGNLAIKDNDFAMIAQVSAVTCQET